MEDNEREDEARHCEEEITDERDDANKQIEIQEEHVLHEDEENNQETYGHYKISDHENPYKQMTNSEKKESETYKEFSFKTLGIGILIGALIISFFWVINSNKSVRDETSDTEQIELNRADTAEALSDMVSSGVMDVSEVVEQCMPSIVSVTNSSVEEVLSWRGIMQQEVSSVGSGIIMIFGQENSNQPKLFGDELL